MTRTVKEQEAYLEQQYFNGTYSDTYYDCTCTGNTPPSQQVPDSTTPSTPSTPTTPTTTSIPGSTIEDQLEDMLNNDTINNPVIPTGDDTFPTSSSYPGNEFIEEPNLPTTTEGWAQQAGDVVNNGLEDIPEDQTKAGAWLLAAVAIGIGIRQLSKRKTKSKK